MAEYIEREALRKVMQMATDDPTCPMHIAATVDQYITEAPAADVAPVVRCKHCTDGIMSNDNKYIICCRLGVGMEFDDFCSHGERKDESIGYVAD